MNRQQKEELVAQLSERLSAAPLVMLADYRGVDVAEISAFRNAMADAGVDYQVAKNSLIKRAIAGTPMEALGEHLTGMTGLVISGDDPIAAAKALRTAVKGLNKDEKFIVKAGFFEGEALDGAAAKKIADLPSREELLSTLLRTITEGPRQLVSVIQAPARDLLYLLNNYSAKLEEQGE